MNRRGFILASMAFSIPSAILANAAPNLGQLLITGFRGTRSGDVEVDKVCHMLEKKHCAGVILLRRNCVSPEQISRLSRTLRDASPSLTPIISIDQEGGRVARLDTKNGFLDWMSAREIAMSGKSDAEIETYWTDRAWQLSEVGINLNYAPVVDLDLNRSNPIIGRLGRAFGSDPAQVSRLATLFIRAHHAAGVKTSLKHFPGHGSSVSDTHRESADISQSWSEVEIEPYKKMVSAAVADSIMNGHLLHPKFTDESWMPSSLSWRSVREIRQSLGFKGVIFTDDMQMGAVEDFLSSDAAAISAVNAGNTFLIYSNYRRSDRINTVERIAEALSRNMNKMSPENVANQILLANNFRSSLR